MVIVPLSTDAPLYHIPFVTGSIIVSNIVIFFATTFQVLIGSLEISQIEWLMINFNQINPVQWFTGSFMHLDFGHLIGNMLFLFPFGLIVEGKIGSLRFLGIYTLLCAATGAITQIPMFLMGSEQLALGASAVIAGIMVIALMWAPENEISIFYWFLLVFFGITEVRVITMALFCIAFDVYEVVFSGFAMSGAMAHTLGSLLGVPIAAHFLRKCTVDCEGWDVVSRNPWLQQYSFFYSKKQQQADRSKVQEVYDPIGTALGLEGASEQSKKRLALSSSVPVHANPADKKKPNPNRGKRKGLYRHEKPVDPVLEREQACQAHQDFNRLAYVLRQSLQTNNPCSLESSFQQMETLKISFGLNEKTLWAYADQLAKQKRWTDTIRPYKIIAEKQGSYANDASLRLAQVYLRVAKRPDLALQALSKINDSVGHGTSSPQVSSVRKKRDELVHAAQAAARKQDSLNG